MRAFLCFYLIQIPRLARLSLLTPCLTLARASKPKTCIFHPVAGESHPSRLFHLQSGDGECLPATQLYLSVFTCPTASLNLPSDAGESLSARQPYIFHPTATYLSVFTCPTQRALTSRRTPARASRPDNFTFSNLLHNEANPSDTAISKPQSDVGKSLPDNNPTFSCSTRLTRPTQRL